MKFRILFFVFILLGATPHWLAAQDASDTLKSSHTKKLMKKTFNQGMKYITTNKKDTIINETSVDVNKIHEGKIVRRIYIQHIGFERSIYDSTKRTKKIIADAADALHGTTKEGIIRQHLFIKKNKPLNPYLLSDNERFIRNLDFIVDCRILVIPLPDQEDSVDISVITKDLFSLGITIGGTIPTAPKIGVYDANLAGLGQRLQFTGLVDATLDPQFTSAAFYRKSSVFGSLTNVELGYTQLNTGSSYGEEPEYAYYIKASRPLVSPYSRIAGGFEFSHNWSQNIEQEPDSTFLKYKYNVSDVWFGLNFGIKQKINNRNRYFLGVRYFDGAYLNKPDQPEYAEEIKYNSVSGYLSEFTFYRQDFFRTRYVFGFGMTEDVPYGLSLAVSTGYITQLDIERPYSAIKFKYSVARRKGSFYSINAQVGSYARSGKLEDGVATTNVTYFTRAMNLNNFKTRAYIAGGYSTLLNQHILPPVEINRSELLAFSADSVWGNRKAFIRIEDALYTPWQLLGFRFAPFLGGGMAWLDCLSCPSRDQIFYEITGGIRTRNESLIFGTIEIRFTFIPATDVTSNKFSFGFKQRLSIKNSGSFVQPPSLVRY
ncbi:MAG TPA: hypothetical protein PLJ60_17165 [Chryseolinea sp.]|nr:hypothetical protein [Chryseolinea sp.]HPM32066.1 hypothetical protein [Chryseolinea sp.]